MFPRFVIKLDSAESFVGHFCDDGLLLLTEKIGGHSRHGCPNGPPVNPAILYIDQAYAQADIEAYNKRPLPPGKKHSPLTVIPLPCSQEQP